MGVHTGSGPGYTGPGYNYERDMPPPSGAQQSNSLGYPKAQSVGSAINEQLEPCHVNKAIHQVEYLIERAFQLHQRLGVSADRVLGSEAEVAPSTAKPPCPSGTVRQLHTLLEVLEGAMNCIEYQVKRVEEI